MENLNSRVSELYVALFGRAPDAEGLNFWVNGLESGAEPDLQAIAQSMYNTTHARAYYPEGANNEDVITSFYQNVLGRSPDVEGLQFWVNALESGQSFGDLVVDMIEAVNNYSGDDPDGLKSKDLFQNRAEVAEIYGASGGDVADAENILTGVTDIYTTVTEKTSGILTDWFDVLRANSVLDNYSNPDDEITGTNEDDFIDAGAGYDTVDGSAGNDLISVGSGDDVLRGGYGQDLLEGGTGTDKLYAGSFYTKEYVPSQYDENNNYVSSYYIVTPDAHNEVLKGEGGADYLYGGYGNDTLLGGDGADYIKGESEGYIYLYSNYEFADGVDGRLLYNDYIDGGAGEDTIDAGYGNDTVYGREDSDDISGGYGDDVVYGGDSDDEIDGDAGSDTLYGEEGNDRIAVGYKDSDADEVYGGAGDDYIYELRGDDAVDAGSGDDKVYFTRTESGGFGGIIAGEGADTIYIDHLYGVLIKDNLTIDLSEDLSAADTIHLDTSGRIASAIEISGYELGVDSLSIDYNNSFDVFGAENYSKNDSVVYSWDGDLISNYVQIVSSTETPWLQRAENPETPDEYGKGVFVIQGDSVSSSNVGDVADFLDAYGNNAEYANDAEHYFVVNIADKGVGIYKFNDDTGADDSIVLDELMPIVLLTGVNTDDITALNSDFFV